MTPVEILRRKIDLKLQHTILLYDEVEILNAQLHEELRKEAANG